jgi:hypothetical protein
MAVAGEPITGRHLVALYSSQVSQGTAVTPATSPGIVSFDLTLDSDMRPMFTIGQAAVLFLKPGVATSQWALNVLAVQTKAVLLLAQRASGVLPWITWGFGADYDSGTSHAFQVQDCKVGQLDVAFEAGGPLTANLSGPGGLSTDVTSLAMANLSETPMMSYEAVQTVGGSAYIAQAFRLSVNHNLEVRPRIHGAAPSTFKRGWSYITEGMEEITGEITRFDKSAVNMHGDTIADGAMVVTFTDIVGGGSPTTITFTFAGVKRGSERFAGEVDGIATYTTPFQAKTLVIS